MAWVNAFDLGPCTVKVLMNYGVILRWSGTLAKGESSPTFGDSGYGDSYIVSVDSGGVVLLTCDDDNSIGTDAISVVVIPQYDLAGSRTRANNISSRSSQLTGSAFDSTGLAGSGSVPLVLIEAFAAASPNVAVFTDAGGVGVASIGVYDEGAR